MHIFIRRALNESATLIYIATGNVHKPSNQAFHLKKGNPDEQDVEQCGDEQHNLTFWKSKVDTLAF
jgi:hypothetical protein